MQKCPICEKIAISFVDKEEIIKYPNMDVKVVVPVGVCSECKFEYTDYRAEEIRMKAHKKYFEK